ncbi:hypothetical protein CWI84_10685 [Idiomarina tyrosinivorans]|uniref:Smp protein n=1 Tax=Idiomarina tyrosinivorans TaxID=1445662 RepID=A0A432ZL94_9GAMM|nr:AhpA/YtjB family protein [Idiomarina tyrosinivorans]RUO78795.1 hypothetical protein CWI84_10685 [Idiomarina tyrosinivorans]
MWLPKIYNQGVIQLNERFLRHARALWKRLLRLSVAAALLIIIISVWNVASVQSQQRFVDHSRQLADMVAIQAQHEAGIWLRQQNTEALDELCQQLIQQRGIINATVRDQFGQRLAFAGTPSSIIDWPNDAPQALVLSQEIVNDGQVSGYLELVFNRHVLLQQSDLAHESLMQQGRVLLLLAMLAGVFFMASFNRIRDRYWLRALARNKN